MESLAGQGPFFDELAVGQEFSGAPALTLTSGLAAAHQAITGDRLALALDHELCRQVTGGGPVAPPGLVWYTHANTIVAQPKSLAAVDTPR